MILWPINRFLWRFPSYFLKASFDNERIAFFSYYYSGNAKPIFEALKKGHHFKKPYWVLISKKQVKKLRKKGIEAYHFKDFRAFHIFKSTPIWISTHITDNFPIPKHLNPLDFIKDSMISILGIEAQPTTNNMRIKEVQLWHGLGFKAWRNKRNRDYLIHASLYCFTSNFFKDEWINAFNIEPNRIKITGYARHDILINKSFDVTKIKNEICVPNKAKIILYAPTWEQRSKSKSIFFWNEKKLQEINSFCEKNDFYFIIRTHHMLKTKYQEFNASRFLYIPMDKYPTTMRLLAATDILITDWSSITNDFIFLKRPTIFIDTPNPFEDDLSLLPEDRAGYIFSESDNIISILNEVMLNPEEFVKQYESKRNQTLEKIYDTPDGKATERCIKEILKLKEDV